VPETYIHRIGRTARAGAAGTAISLCDPEEAAFLRDIEKLIRRSIPVTEHRSAASSSQKPPLPAHTPASENRPPVKQRGEHGAAGNGTDKRQPRRRRPDRRRRAPQEQSSRPHTEIAAVAFLQRAAPAGRGTDTRGIAHSNVEG
jgi:ATP-dependent RNA helicase RhlE